MNEILNSSVLIIGIFALFYFIFKPLKAEIPIQLKGTKYMYISCSYI